MITLSSFLIILFILILFIVIFIIYEYIPPLSLRDKIIVSTRFLNTGYLPIRIISNATGKYLVIKNGVLYADGALDDVTNIWYFNNFGNLLNKFTGTTLISGINTSDQIFANGPVSELQSYNFSVGGKSNLLISPVENSLVVITVMDDFTLELTPYDNTIYINAQNFSYNYI